MDLIEMLRKVLEYDDITKSPDYSTVLEQLELPDDEDPEILRETLEEELEALAEREGAQDDDDEAERDEPEAVE